MKTCTKCKEIKASSEFHKATGRKDGLYCWCKACRTLYSQAPTGRAGHRARVLRYSRTEKGKARLASYQQTEKYKAYRYRYRKSDKNKVCQARYVASQKLLHPERWKERCKARNVVNHAIVAGKVPRPDTFKCAYHCGRQAEQYHHNKGYELEHALDVVPACRICHRQLDKKIA